MEFQRASVKQRWNPLMQRTGRERPAADQERYAYRAQATAVEAGRLLRYDA